MSAIIVSLWLANQCPTPTPCLAVPLLLAQGTLPKYLAFLHCDCYVGQVKVLASLARIGDSDNPHSYCMARSSTVLYNC